MDRIRDARRTTIVATNGLPRRRHRNNGLRDSPEEDGPVDFQETARLRDRGTLKKDRDRDRERDRFSRSKRRRADRLMHGTNREDGGEDSSEESVNDEEEDEDEDGGGSVRIHPPNPASLSSSTSMLNHRKSYPPAKSFRAAPTWKAADEMIKVSVPRKARSASTKRSHECWVGGGVGAEPIQQQSSISPVTQSFTAMAASLAPASPSSSGASARKKLANGPNLRPPKASSKKSTSAQDEIEIEIAEVLYGMMRQPQGPSKQQVLANDTERHDPRESNKSAADSKSGVSSPISNSSLALPSSSTNFPHNSSSSVTTMAAIAPKRKRPRPIIKNDDENPANISGRNVPVSSLTKVEIDQPAKIETTLPNVVKMAGSAAEVSFELGSVHAVAATLEAQPESTNPDNNVSSYSTHLTEGSGGKDKEMGKEEPQSPKKEGIKLDDNHGDKTVTKANSTISEIDNQREEKFQIDLMAPPPLRSSPERDSLMSSVAIDPKQTVLDAEIEDDKAVENAKEEAMDVENVEAEAIAEEVDSNKSIVAKERNVEIQLDMEKTDRDSGNGGGINENKPHQHFQKQQLQSSSEKNVQTISIPLPMSVPGWPGGLPPMGYMTTPLQGVVSMDGSNISSAPIQPPNLLLPQPRPKRCATHFYVARNIGYHQQIARMNPFWPAGAGSPSLFGTKPCNPNAVPSTELHGNPLGRGKNGVQEKGQSLSLFPGHSGRDKASQPANIVDTAQRNQILLQQGLPPGAPTNLLHGPAFVFPLSQQQAASVRPGSVKPPSSVGTTVTTTSNCASLSGSAAAAVANPAMSFNYTNLPGNETQYLTILQNNGYPFPIPAHVGASPQAYRGTHAQAMPFFSGSFFPSQILHHSQIQLQQQAVAPSQTQPTSQQGRQNHSIANVSLSSQKHLQNQQQRPSVDGVNGSSMNLQGFSGPKCQSFQSQQLQQQNHVSHQARQLESEMGREDSPSTSDSRVSRASMNVYSQNFAMPVQLPNFAVMSPASLAGASGSASVGAGNGEKQQQPQLQSSKVGGESSQAFAMSFASVNGSTTMPGLDLSSISPNHPIFQSIPEATRRGYQMMAAAAAAQVAQQKNHRAPDEGKMGCGGDSSNIEEERKAVLSKSPQTVSQSIGFSRTDLADTSISTAPSNNVVDSSSRTLNGGSASARPLASVMPSGVTVSTVNAINTQQQLQRTQQQVIETQKQQQFTGSMSRSKTVSNGIVYSDHHLPSSASMPAKFPNALPSFSQNLKQSNSSSSPVQSPQWKNSSARTTSQVLSPSMSSSSTSVKCHPQQGRTQQSHTQISFAANPKLTMQSNGQQPANNNNQSPSPPVMAAASPTASSMSKGGGGGGSPVTTSSSPGNKVGQQHSLPSQQNKNSPSGSSHKSSPVGGRNVPSILGNPHISIPSGAGAKPQAPQQLQHVSKQSLQQAQFFFSNSCFAQPSHSTNAATTSAASGYPQRRRPEQQQQLPHGPSGSQSSGMLSLSSNTSDPAKAVAAMKNMKGGSLTAQTMIHPSQFCGGAAQSSASQHHLGVPPGFSYVHAVSPAVKLKPTETKQQPAGE